MSPILLLVAIVTPVLLWWEHRQWDRSLPRGRSLLAWIISVSLILVGGGAAVGAFVSLGLFFILVLILRRFASFRKAFPVIVVLSVGLLAFSVLDIRTSRQRYAELAAKYPFESLANRLHRRDLPLHPVPVSQSLFEEPPLLKPADARPYNRIESIRYVHSRTVSQFLSIDGNGVGRMRGMMTYSLELPDEPILWSEVAKAEEWDVTEQRAGREANVPTLDLASELAHGHRDSATWFFWPQRYGLVYGPAQTAGFLSHSFTRGPATIDRHAFNVHPAYDTVYVDDEPLRLSNLQLIGLLYHDRPVAYDLETMPTLLNAETAATRELDAFESQALQKLQSGYELEYSFESQRIRALGALRNRGDCLICHDQPENGLLGAFSYWLNLRSAPGEAGERPPADIISSESTVTDLDYPLPAS